MAKNFNISTYYPPNGGATPTLVTGRLLVHHRYDPIGRAFLALDIYSGVKQPVEFTLRQAAWLARANETYAWWASRRQAQREAIEAGIIPLVPPHGLVAPKTKKGNGHALLKLGDIDDAMLNEIARMVGSNRMLDAAAVAEQH